MAVLITDLLIGNVADIFSEQIKSLGGMAVFYTVSAVSISGQFYLLRKLRNEGGLKSDRLRKIVWIAQYILIVIIILIILQIIFGSFYFTNLLSLSTAISYGLTIVLMGILVWRFLIWFKRSKNLALLLYWPTLHTVNQVKCAQTAVTRVIQMQIYLERIRLKNSRRRTQGVTSSVSLPADFGEIFCQAVGFSSRAASDISDRYQ
jgi:hypothetical protein